MLKQIRSLRDGHKLQEDLPSVIEIGAEAFEALRYIYEERKPIFLLSDFPDLLRGVILKRMPWWTSYQPAPPVQRS
jgi:hypothetical protein